MKTPNSKLEYCEKAAALKGTVHSSH